MAPKIAVKSASKLTSQELRYCYNSSFRSYGDLSEWLYQARHWPEYKDTKVILVQEDGIFLGWGLRRSDGEVGFWTRRSARGKGIAVSMVKTAAKLGDIKVHPHDIPSRALFRKAGYLVKSKNYTLYDKDADNLKRLKAEYESIGRDCRLEIDPDKYGTHKLIVFAYAQKKEKNNGKDAAGSKTQGRGTVRA